MSHLSHRRVAPSLAALLLLATLAGCSVIGHSYRAQEERAVSPVHQPQSPVRVTTKNGSVRITADAARRDVLVTARLTAAGATQEEADQRLAAIDVRVQRLEDGTLSIAAVFPGERRGNEGCSFEIALPDALGAAIETTNGGITLSGLGGEALAQTSNGSVRITAQGGMVRVRTSNGRIEIVDPADTVDVGTSNGGVEVSGFAGPVEVRTSNGSVTCRAGDAATGAVRIHTSNGSVTLDVPASLGGRVTAATSNGSVRTFGSKATTSGGDRAKVIQLGDAGPDCVVQTSNGNVTVSVRGELAEAPPR